MENSQPQQAAEQSLQTVEVELSTPIVRGVSQTISKLMIRKPVTRELRGLKLMDVLQMDVTALSVLVPRICDPFITKPEFDDLEMADILGIGVAVAGFFEPSKKTN
jgi:hypothetical protein